MAQREEVGLRSGWRRSSGIGSAALAVALLLGAACSRPFYVGTEGIRIGDGQPPSRSPSPSTPGQVTTVPTTRKEVVGKEPPSTLIASDGTRCTVTAPRYEEVEEGDWVWCDWQNPHR